MKKSPRQELSELNQRNANDGFYGTANQFAILIQSRLAEKARKLLCTIFNGCLPVNEHLEYTKIYKMLLDGKSMKAIKESYK